LKSERPFKSAVTENEILIEIIGVERRLSSVEGEAANLLVDLSDFTEGLGENSDTLVATLMGLAASVVPAGVGAVRDKCVPVEHVHDDVQFVQRVTADDGITQHHALELLVNVGSRVHQDLVGKTGDVLATIGFSSKPSGAAKEARICSQKSLEKNGVRI
tara:strand:- start:1482 stop:1961 length:480 start_codon:yes stop_codon:yes gene_type:complete